MDVVVLKCCAIRFSDLKSVFSTSYGKNHFDVDNSVGYVLTVSVPKQLVLVEPHYLDVL